MNNLSRICYTILVWSVSHLFKHNGDAERIPLRAPRGRQEHDNTTGIITCIHVNLHRKNLGVNDDLYYSTLRWLPDLTPERFSNRQYVTNVT